MEPLLKEERQDRILTALQENKRVTVSELSERFGISDVTIRRDLAELAANGRLLRTHRGALAVVAAPPEPPVVQRMALESEEKEQLARAAVTLVQDGDSIFITSGSTMTYFARFLGSVKRLTVVTNALNIAMEAAALETDIAVVLTGGVMRRDELSVLGHLTELTLGEMRVNKIFSSVQALSIESGWTTDHLPEVQTTRRVLEMARELVVLVAPNKLGRSAAAVIAPVTRITTLVTNPAADPDFLEQIKERGIQVMVAR